MKRVVLDCLPMIDPVTEAKMIVWSGMGDVIYEFLSDEEREGLGPSPFPAALGGCPTPTLDILTDNDRGITFCSGEVDRFMQWVEGYYPQVLGIR